MRIKAWALLAVAAAVPAGQGGEISGRVVATRRLTKERLVLASYQPRGLLVKPAAVQTHPETSRMVAYLEVPRDESALPERAELRQRRREFTEEIVIVPAGSTVSFPNDDPIFHSVFSLSGARPFDLGYYPKDQTRAVRFDKPGVIQVYCHLHREMNAAIIVAPSRWYARPDSAGRFQFTDVPEGTFKLVVWHKSAGFFREQVSVPKTGVAEVTMELPTIKPPVGE